MMAEPAGLSPDSDQAVPVPVPAPLGALALEASESTTVTVTAADDPTLPQAAALPPTIEVPNENITFYIRAVDGDWVMGEDWQVDVHKDLTITELKEYIQTHRGISSYRMQFRLKNGKLVPSSKSQWSIRRHGIGTDYVLIVEPTLSGAWYWNPYSYYADIVLSQVLALIDQSRYRRTTLTLLSEKVRCPPPIKTSLRVFLRKYPDVIHMHHDLTHDLIWIQRPSMPFQLPSFSNFPIELGETAMFDGLSMTFDFDAHADIDDTKPVELDFEIPDLVYELSILAAEGLTLLQSTAVEGRGKRGDFPCPMVTVTFNDRFIGATVPRQRTSHPTWAHETFRIPVSANLDIAQCSVLMEVWDSVPETDGTYRKTTFLGAVELPGPALKDVLNVTKQETRVWPITQRRASTEYLFYQDSIEGHLTFKAGKAGFEVAVCTAQGIVPIPKGLQSKPFAMLYWNKEYYARSFLEQTFVRNPVWNEAFSIPALKSGQLLTDCRLEIQLWGSEPTNEDEKCEFLGSLAVKEKELATWLTARQPWATPLKKELKRSNNVPLNQRKKPVSGYLYLLGGNAGLVRQPPRKTVELWIMHANRLAKVHSVFYTLMWDHVLVARSNACQLEPSGKQMKAVFGHRYRLDIDGGLQDCSKSRLQIDMYEQNLTDGGAGEYLGRVVVEGEALMALMDNRYAVSSTFEIDKDPALEERHQRMARGEFLLRGGSVGSREETERTVTVHACRNLVKWHETSFKAGGINFLASSLSAVVKWNGEDKGRSKHGRLQRPLSPQQIQELELEKQEDVETEGEEGDQTGGGGGGDVAARWEDDDFHLPLKLKPAPPPPAAPKGKKSQEVVVPLEPLVPEYTAEGCVLEIELWLHIQSKDATEGDVSVVIAVAKCEGPELVGLLSSETPRWLSLPLKKHPSFPASLKGNNANLMGLWEHVLQFTAATAVEIGHCGDRYTSPHQYKSEVEQAVVGEQQRRAKIIADALAEAEREEQERQRLEELALLKEQGIELPPSEEGVVDGIGGASIGVSHSDGDEGAPMASDTGTGAGKKEEEVEKGHDGDDERDGEGGSDDEEEEEDEEEGEEN